MCVDVDEPYEVIDSYPAQGKCHDCGWEGPVIAQTIRREDDYWASEEGQGFELAVDRLLDNGVPDWTISVLRAPAEKGGWLLIEDDELEEAAREVAYVLDFGDGPRPGDDTQWTFFLCDNCGEASEWLMEWCHSYMYGMYRDDIVSHWQEDEVTRSHAMGRLVIAARDRWIKRNGERMTALEVRRLVRRSLDVLKAELTKIREASRDVVELAE